MVVNGERERGAACLPWSRRSDVGSTGGGVPVGGRRGAGIAAGLVGWHRPGQAEAAAAPRRPAVARRPHHRLRLWLRARTGAPPGRSGGAGVRGLPVPEGPGARRLAADCSSRLRVLPLDVTSDQQVADAVVSVQAALADASGTELWAVLNNAGIADIGETDVTPLEKFKQVLDVNTVGAIRVSKAFLPLLKKSKGRLINVNSPCGRVPIPMLSPYCVSKSALIMFTDMLRMEMKKWSITVSSVQPSFYETPMADVERLQVKYFENTEKTLPDDIRQAARKNCEVLLRGSKWFALKNISEVIDEMVSACVGRDVQRVHMPGFIPTIIMTVAANLPDWLREILIQIIMVIIKIIWG
ncbi:estradiol 17-beta-dehydrogenase 2-like [Schistocerca nitens]|uniref:estradiol 17-beta-dehydrogenase 2-like n=1 Tax=Schistocerca nitens TaxID=7011 RepID=UPI0021180616|nr:estradiol 17-beta-dehydrogenase 2-like [Schistocerca nitens]